MKEAVIEFGSNLGNRIENINKAIKSIDSLLGTHVIGISKFYETEPVGVPDKQGNYINCCAKITTALSPHALLGACLGIEASMGRIREFKNQSRIIDIDLLLYEDFSYLSDELTVPHPRMLERAFVMIPLADLYKGKNALGIDFSQYLNNVDTNGVNPVD